LTGNWKSKLPPEIQLSAESISNNIENQKGVFTVLITLGVQKIYNPNQDIRYHQDNMKDGFSGRSIDTKYITPTLKELQLTSMSESGWLTRSLEQPYPYNQEYAGKITSVKNEFLDICLYYQTYPKRVPEILKYFLSEAEKIRKKNIITIKPVTKENNFTISKIVELFDDLLSHKYKDSGISKIPVIATYSIFELTLHQVKRYQNCKLSDLGSHTASDRTSKTSGDIEIFKNNDLYESYEIKHEIPISTHIINRIFEKIKMFNPNFYYFLTTNPELGINQEVIDKINSIRKSHGCEIRVIKFCDFLSINLGLLISIDDYINLLNKNITEDKEIKISHKIKYRELMENT
tara:strand:+ start:1246 stop:2289 length:1044 start_codon:yes stop_codon:yes gene_type:complete